MNGYFTLSSVFALVCLELVSVAFGENCAKTTKGMRVLSAELLGLKIGGGELRSLASYDT